MSTQEILGIIVVATACLILTIATIYILKYVFETIGNKYDTEYYEEMIKYYNEEINILKDEKRFYKDRFENQRIINQWLQDAERRKQK